MKKNNFYSKKSVFKESLRTIKTNIEFSEVDKGIRTIALTSVDQSDGKSTLSYELAKVFAEDQKKVLLIDCDFMHPSIGNIAGIHSEIGLSNIILRKKNSESVILKDRLNEYLDILLTGPIPPVSSIIFNTQYFYDLLKEMESIYDYVFIDTPPIGFISDTMAISTKVEGVLLVCVPYKTERSQMKTSIEKLKNVGANLMGVIFNQCQISQKKYNNYYV